MPRNQSALSEFERPESDDSVDEDFLQRHAEQIVEAARLLEDLGPVLRDLEESAGVEPNWEDGEWSDLREKSQAVAATVRVEAVAERLSSDAETDCGYHGAGYEQFGFE